MASTGQPDPFHHVLDSAKWEFFSEHVFGREIAIHLPSIPIPYLHFGEGFGLRVYSFQLTKFMVLEVIAAVLIILIYWPLSRRAATGSPPRGFFWNSFESILTFLRNDVAKPSLAHEPHEGEEHGHGAHHDPQEEVDKYVPYLWSVFLFILFCNLLGMIPYMGSPTGNIWVTGALAVCSFVLFHGAATMKMGLIPYLQALWPKMEIPMGMGYFIKPMIFVIELLGTVIKSFVLAVRLFANLMAGHLVLSVILMFILMTRPTTGALHELGLWGGVTLASILGVVALSLLELFVAFLQAFIFTFLTALFLGMAINPEH